MKMRKGPMLRRRREHNKIRFLMRRNKKKKKKRNMMMRNTMKRKRTKMRRRNIGNQLLTACTAFLLRDRESICNIFMMWSRSRLLKRAVQRSRLPRSLSL